MQAITICRITLSKIKEQQQMYHDKLALQCLLTMSSNEAGRCLWSFVFVHERTRASWQRPYNGNKCESSIFLRYRVIIIEICLLVMNFTEILKF